MTFLVLVTQNLEKEMTTFPISKIAVAVKGQKVASE